jgi:hypothetical protein
MDRMKWKTYQWCRFQMIKSGTGCNPGGQSGSSVGCGSM